MDAQQLHDYMIKPTLEAMGSSYNTPNARMLLLATAAIESNCGYWVAQRGGGPAMGVWQMEPETEVDIWNNCDALKIDKSGKQSFVLGLLCEYDTPPAGGLIDPRYACAMARLKYAMDPEPLPSHNDKKGLYRAYKRIYNTELGASTWEKWCKAWDANGLDGVIL